MTSTKRISCRSDASLGSPGGIETDGKEHAVDDMDTSSMDDEDQRRLAADLFNLVWTLLEMPNRTADQNERMLNAAHASRFHWGEVGGPVNLARGDWQVSRVYAVLDRPEPALHHASRCLDVCRENGIGGFDLACAYEALARANVVARRPEDALRYAEMAREISDHIEDEEDREILVADLATLPA
jgi:hypothetical protein